MKNEQFEDVYPLSPMQQGMLYHSLAANRTGVDIEQVLGTLREPLDSAAFARAWQCVVARHAILRSSFHWNGTAEPMQQVRASAKLPFHSEDWRDLTSEECDKAFATWLTADRLQGFEITQPPLARVTLFRVADAEWKFVWTLHHLLLDARGIALVLQEVFAIYDALHRGVEPNLSEPPRYRAHIEALRKLDRAAAEKFWRETLNGFSTPTPLVVARTNSGEIHGDICAEKIALLSESLTVALKTLAQQHDLTLNTIVQGAWALLWHRYSGESDVVFGAVRAGRRSTIENAERVAGLFINTVPVRARFNEATPLLSWLAQLRAQWMAMRPFEHTALSDIQNWTVVPRDQPLFETLFNFQSQPWDASLRESDDDSPRREFSLRSQPNYPLALDACGGDALELKLIYDRRRFDDATIGRMLGHLRTLLESFAAHPTQTLGEIPLLTTQERQQLLFDWNSTDADYPRDKCIHEIIAEQAERTPDAPAVADEHTQITYRELNERAETLAFELRKRGVAADVCVGVLFARNVEMIVAWLAVLKAGGAYLPIDPRSPKDRLAFMLREVNAPLLIASEQLRELSPPDCDVLTPTHAPRTTHQATNASSSIPECHPTNLAYVIFTSGSTGLPKAVAIEHRSLMNLVTWHQREYDITAADCATQLANPAFDASVWEVWPHLAAGASVRIVPDEVIRWPKKLVEWLACEKISRAFIPTPLAEALFAEIWPKETSLRAMLTGGDALHSPPPENFPCPLINHYGPTESTIVTTSELIPAASSSNHVTPPIGRPIQNTRVYVLDSHLRPVPIGVPGELHIGGNGLARGYLNRAELTAEKFIANPFADTSSSTSTTANSRLYKTGDLVRWREDGRLEFLGRLDRQIKIRGHRIEPAEIESWLTTHPAVREAAVCVADGELAAFVVLRTSAKPEQLREFLKSHVPDYMIPSRFAFVDALPLTANGKVDRIALKTNADAQPESEFVAPRNTIEESLAAIWREVLGRERIGIHDNFFRVGGHSLLAARVISRACEVFDRALPLQVLFDSPTIAGLADKIAAARAGTATLISRRSRNGTLPLSFAQERLWFLEQIEPGVPFNNIPFAYRIEGPLNATALESALEEIVRRHEPFRTAIHNQNGRPVATREPDANFTLAIEDLSALPESQREAKARQLIASESRRPFDLTKTPLLRATLARLDERTHWLALVTHHIACDGWSMDIFHRELAELYDAFAHGVSPSLPEPPVSYADFADWQREILRADGVESDVNWWKRRLDGITPLALPTDRPRPALQTFRGGILPLELPVALTDQLTNLASTENSTLFMLLLAAFQVLLLRYSGQEDICIGTPVAGRSRIETEKLIGLFLNTIVLRGTISGDPSFREFLRRTRQTVLDAFAHQELPFEKVADALQAQRDLSRPPVFQAMFVLQNEPRQPLALRGLKINRESAYSGTSKFDLTLSLEETSRGLRGEFEFNTDLFDEATTARLRENFRTLLEGIVAAPETRVSHLPILSSTERNRLLTEWNDTAMDFPAEKCIHELFVEQRARTPEAIAVVFDDEHLTYRELDERAEQVADELRKLGVGPDVRVGICVERSLEMMVGLLGILKSGGCYVPLDPTYPKERLAFMLNDSQAAVLVTQEHLQDVVKCDLPMLFLDSPRTPQSTRSCEITHHAPRTTSANLAYVIYTSGSTGQPKGVMLTHRNVVNFFTAMDRVLGTRPGVWLAITSISFDISVLELFWTLARGFTVVIHSDAERKAPQSRVAKSAQKTDFSLFYFASDAGGGGAEGYRLLIEGAKFADAHDFAGVWTPERHFHPFGGIYPNAALTSAAIAMVTRRVQIRAGSVVLPLHHPVRAAEDWSVVDNLSNGRAAISIASGWHANDFALAPENYTTRKELMRDRFEIIRRLWRGEVIELPNGVGEKIPVQLYPRPIQSELPMWLTTSGNPETFSLAGELSLNLLTHLSGQGVEQLARKIKLYRDAWRQHGHEKRAHVSLMLHTFLWSDEADSREMVVGPLREYLRMYRVLSENAHARGNGPITNGDGADVERLLRDAAERYFAACGLFGTPDKCARIVEKLRDAGVDEIACLIDFGIATDTVIESLQFLDELRERCQPKSRSVTETKPAPTIAEEITRHGVTHLQCTPSLAAGLVLSPETLNSLKSLKVLLLGGEALPGALAQKIRRVFTGELLNMYGPTETTIWSAVHRVCETNETIPIGRPIANTEIFILDAQLQPVPIGVPGELFIGGEGVARGYLNRPELTAERFVNHPFGKFPQITQANDSKFTASARLYRTGDLARYRADGTLEYLGRLDHQVKLRGHRIELGEIESALRSHPDVRDCAVVVREFAPGDQRLVAYVVASQTPENFAVTLRAWLESKLPGYMIPNEFAWLDKLPLTPNGKIDRKALPSPQKIRPATHTAFIAPRSDIEKKLANIWEELLHVERVGTNDNFFDLGGHSLLVVQMQARLREAFGVELPIVRLFQHPTIRALAGHFGNAPQKSSLANVRDRGRRLREAFTLEPEPELAT